MAPPSLSLVVLVMSHDRARSTVFEDYVRTPKSKQKNYRREWLVRHLPLSRAIYCLLLFLLLILSINNSTKNVQ